MWYIIYKYTLFADNMQHYYYFQQFTFPISPLPSSHIAYFVHRLLSDLLGVYTELFNHRVFNRVTMPNALCPTLYAKKSHIINNTFLLAVTPSYRRTFFNILA